MQSVQAETAYRKAADIGQQLGDGHASSQAKWGLWINANLRRKTGLARDRAGELTSLAEQSGDRELLLEAYHCQFSTAYFRGQIGGCRRAAGKSSSSTTWRRIAISPNAFGGHLKTGVPFVVG
jgi:hypothetical protein